MPSSTTFSYNTNPVQPRGGLDRRYQHRLHANVGRQNTVPQSNEIAITKNEDIDIYAAPKGSSDEDEQEKDNGKSDSESSSPRRKVPRRFPQVRVPKGHKKAPEEVGDLFDDSRPSQSKRARKYGKRDNMNIHTSQYSRKANKEEKSKQQEKSADSGFKIPSGEDALRSLESRKPSFSSSGTDQRDNDIIKSLRPQFNIPIEAPPTPKKAPKVDFKEPRSRIPTPKKERKPKAGVLAKRASQTGAENAASKTFTVTDELARFSKTVDPSLADRLKEFNVPAARATSPSSSSSPSSPLSSAHSNDFDINSSATTNNIEPLEPLSLQPSGPRCPQCKAPIPETLIPDFLAKHSLPPTHRLTYGQARTFCRHHKESEAKDHWILAGYPDINWSAFTTRLVPLQPHIQAIINDATPSFYRERLRQINPQQREKGGRATLATELEERGEEAELLGYYGSRGGRLISDFIMANFQRNLKKAQSRDPDLRLAGGVGAFVQMVLVPEVVQALVVRDLRVKTGERERSVEEEEARRIMEESMEVGKLLCEEEEVGYGE